MHRIVALTFVALASLTVKIAAQPPAVGDVLVPRGELEARSEHPSLFSVAAPGDVVTAIAPSEEYVVKDVVTVRSLLLRMRQYVLVTEREGSGPCHHNDCWVYNGSDSSELEPNLVPPATRVADR